VHLRAPGDFAGDFRSHDVAAAQPHQCAINRSLFIRTIDTLKTRSSILTLINCEPAFRFYRSLRAVKALLAALCSTLTLLAPRRKRSLSVVLGQQGCSSWVSFEASNLALMVASKTVSLSAAIRLSCSRWASP
jgi:hypothetical protein